MPFCPWRSRSAAWTTALKSSPRARIRRTISASVKSAASSASTRSMSARTSAETPARRRVDAAEHFGGRRRVVAWAPVVRARQPLAVDLVEHRAAQAFVHPGGHVAGEARIDGQAFVQLLAGSCGLAGQFVQMRPRRFGVHEIRRQGRNAAPVVRCPRRRFFGSTARPQVRRRLDAHLRAEQDARHGDGPQQFVQVRLRRLAHLRARLGAEVLDDDLLNVPVHGVDAANGEQRFDALQARPRRCR